MTWMKPPPPGWMPNPYWDPHTWPPYRVRRRDQYGIIDLGPSRQEFDELKRRVEQLERERQDKRPAQITRPEDV